ncbi:metabolite traffic protein EboE [Persicirhabdus sediminis]|uniref:Metabolite traffic protein EboE n=1 Tax=Persicirhabdus sediminis TaxID=454144 RepID=A0A8J7MAM6_9BACT|nr:metabolite traffic protein EboE [Persicirhabdus sediminis]MBK1790014.1 metabolite traffic protein EboE [Persicirhabdus sediminis]
MLPSYCTNIHPAENWEETFHVLKTDVLAVRDGLAQDTAFAGQSFPIGLRLSALAAEELLANQGVELQIFIDWLAAENCHVFTINGFPYGAFHGTSVKEKVYQPDWTTPERLHYTKQLFTILAAILPSHMSGSVSTLPASFKAFGADESIIFSQLEECAEFIEDLSFETGLDLHLGLEPEPLGHFENTEETIAFFQRLFAAAKDADVVREFIGVNFDTCHFAIEFDQAGQALSQLQKHDIKISKIHLSSALSFNPNDPAGLEKISQFNEPTYLHQVITRGPEGQLNRYADLPDYLRARQLGQHDVKANEARVHFHIPVYAEPEAPLSSTMQTLKETLSWCKEHPDACQHFEIETYTWGVLPNNLQQGLTQQIISEFRHIIQLMEG